MITKQKKKSMAIGFAAENYLLLIQIIPQVTIWVVILIIEVIMCYKQGNTILSTIIDCAGGEELLEKKKEIVRDDGSSVFVEKGSSSKGKESRSCIVEEREDKEEVWSEEVQEKVTEFRVKIEKRTENMYKILENMSPERREIGKLEEMSPERREISLDASSEGRPPAVVQSDVDSREEGVRKETSSGNGSGTTSSGSVSVRGEKKNPGLAELIEKGVK